MKYKVIGCTGNESAYDLKELTAVMGEYEYTKLTNLDILNLEKGNIIEKYNNNKDFLCKIEKII